MKHKASISFVIVVILSTTACVPIWQQRSYVDPEKLWQYRHSELQQLDSWQFEGRTVITQDKEGWNAGLQWLENDGEYSIRLLGPFAQGGVMLKGDPQRVILTMDDGRQLTAATPEALILEALGVHMPVSALRDWVRGMPYSAEDFDSVRFDEQGRIIQLHQQGWDIQYMRYVPFKQYSMPAKIFIQHDSLSLRLVISDWSPIK